RPWMHSVEMEWIAELRRVTVLFMHLEGFDYTADEVVDQLQAAHASLRAAITAHGGNLHQFIVDDKGTVLIAVFGLPTSSHEDDVLRATRAALRLEAEAEQLGLAGSIAVATGLA